MKRLIFILLLVLVFASCEKTKDYLSCEVVSIDTEGEVWYSVTNHSAYNFNIKAIITIETEGGIEKHTTDCFNIGGLQTITDKYTVPKEVYFADIKVKMCN